MALTDDEQRLKDTLRELDLVFNGLTQESLRLTAAERAQAEAAAKFAARLGAAGSVAESLTKAFVSYNKAAYEGASSSKAASAAISDMADAAKFAGLFLALLVPGGPLVRGLVAGLGLLTAKLVEASKLVAEQTDTIYKSFQDLAQAGAAGAGGMQDVFNSLMKVGLGTEKFAEYIRIVNESAQDMANFGLTVNRGRKIFETTMSSLTDEQRVQLEMLGLDRTAQAEAAMGYIRQQRLLTQGTKQQMDTSSEAVMRYVKETDLLTRITGLNRKEQEKLVEEAMRNEAYNATLQEIRERHGDAAAKQVQNALIMAQKAGPETAKQFQDSLSGFIGASDDAGKAFLATGGQMQEFTQRLRSGQIRDMNQTAGEMNKVFNAYGQTARQFRGQAQMMNYGSTFGSFYEAVKAGQISMDDLVKAVGEAQNSEQKKLLQDALTKRQAEAENNIREHQLNLQKTTNLLMAAFIEKNATAAENLRKLSEAALAAARALTKIPGAEQTGPAAEARKKSAEKDEALATIEDQIKALKAQERQMILDNASADDRRKVQDKLAELEKKRVKALEEANQAAYENREAHGAERKARRDALKAKNEITQLEENIIRDTRKLDDLQKKLDDAQSALEAGKRDPKIRTNVAAMAELERSARIARQEFEGMQASLQASRERLVETRRRAGGGGSAPGGAPAAPGGAPAAPAAPAAPGGAPAAPAAPGGGAQEGTGTPPTLLAMQEERGRAQLDKIFVFGKRGPDSTKDRFLQIEDQLESRAIAAANMYFEATGRPIQLNSAVRTRAEQEALFAETDPATYDQRTGLALHKQTGLPVLHPSRGGSHQDGTAIDIQNTALRSTDSEAQHAFATFLRQPLGARDAVHWSLADGGVATGPKSGYPATLHGTEAVVPLPDGQQIPVKLNGGIGPTFAGYNEFTGYNMGPMSTDLNLIKDLATSMGAFDRATQTITNPATWKEIVGSGIGMNYQIGDMKFGSSMLPNLGQEMAQRISEIVSDKGVDQTEAFKTMVAEFRTAMMDAVSKLTENQNNADVTGLLADLVTRQTEANDISNKILSYAQN